MTHIINDDCYGHTKDLGCFCNPQLVHVEGEDLVIHNTNYDGNYEGDSEIREIVRTGDVLAITS